MPLRDTHGHTFKEHMAIAQAKLDAKHPKKETIETTHVRLEIHSEPKRGKCPNCGAPDQIQGKPCRYCSPSTQKESS